MNHEQNEGDLDWLRRRLVAIDKAIRDAAPDDRELRFGLAEEGDRCRALLRSGNGDAVAAARASWTARAANKGSHQEDVAALEGRARNMGGLGGGGH